MKKFFAMIFVGAIFIATMANVLAANYIGNSNSGKFHYADCRTVKKMNPANKVNFSSREEAVSAGYIPCKVCNP